MELLTIEWASAFNIIGFSFLMVFLLLLLIIMVIVIFGKLITLIDKISQERAEKKVISSIRSVTKNTENQISTEITPVEEEIPAEVIAAIGMALYSYFSEVHDEESNIITIKKLSKLYSPWSSKIYGVNALTNH